MAVPYPSYFLCPSHHLQTSSRTFARAQSPSIPRLSGLSQYFEAHHCSLTVKSNRVFQNSRLSICCAINMTAGQSGDPEKFHFDHLLSRARNLWENAPEPVKSFPWNRALENFIQLILDLVVAVIKYLSVPLLTISSLSEMSYCAYHKKLLLVPFPLLLGIVIAGALKDTVLELSPRLQDAEVPWHLIAIALFFTLIKLPGPYYPFWGRILIPHIANGVLWRTIWCTFLWFRKPRKESGEVLQ